MGFDGGNPGNGGFPTSGNLMAPAPDAAVLDASDAAMDQDAADAGESGDAGDSSDADEDAHD